MQDWGVAGFPTRNYLIDAGSCPLGNSGQNITWTNVSNTTITNGGLTVTGTGGGGQAKSTAGKPSGLWVYELLVNAVAGGTTMEVGLISENFIGGGTRPFNSADGIAWRSNGAVGSNSSTLATTATWAAGDYLQLAINVGTKSVQFIKNGTTLTTQTWSGITGTTVYPDCYVVNVSTDQATLTAGSLHNAGPASYSPWA